MRALETFGGELDGADWSLSDALLAPSAPPRR
jgi:hypothetical protein